MGQVHLRFQEMNRNEAGSRGIADRSGLRRTRADHVARRYRQRVERNAIAYPAKYASSISVEVCRAVRGLPPDARQIISRVGRGFGPPEAVAVALF